jgi:hypothetical protein
MAPELQRLLRPGQTLFGDVLVDEEGVGGGPRFKHGNGDDVTPFGQPGRAGREKQMHRLTQQQSHHDDDDDWFDNRRWDQGRPRRQEQQRPPTRNVRVHYQSSGPVLDAQDYHAPPPPPFHRAPSPLPGPRLPPRQPRRMVDPRPMYFDGAPAGRRPGPSRGYPPPHEISAGYQHADFASRQMSAPNRGPGLSIRGAARRRQEEDRNQRGGEGGYGGGYGGRDGGRGRDRGKEWPREERHARRGQRNGEDNEDNEDRRRY